MNKAVYRCYTRRTERCDRFALPFCFHPQPFRILRRVVYFRVVITKRSQYTPLSDLKQQPTHFADETDELHVLGLDCFALAVARGHVRAFEVRHQQILRVLTDGRDRLFAFARHQGLVAVAHAPGKLLPAEAVSKVLRCSRRFNLILHTARHWCRFEEKLVGPLMLVYLGVNA